jgi:hypothetical protein
VWKLFKILIIKQLYDPQLYSGYNKGTCTPMFIAALFTIAKLWKQPRCPTTDE